MSDERYHRIRQKLTDREHEDRMRKLLPVEPVGTKKHLQLDGKTFLNFCSNDYLGLSTHPELIRRSVEFTQRYGTGSSASRLVSGSLRIHHELEEKIAALYGSESSLFFSSGFQANMTLLPALTDRNDLILADKKVHNSMIRGGLSGRAEFRRFRHNDCDHLESLLKSYKSSRRGDCWVMTESLFSMDGDFAPLEEISRLCQTYGAYLMVDEAHAFGVFGKRGLGLSKSSREKRAESQRLAESSREQPSSELPSESQPSPEISPKIDLLLGTFGKAGGTSGAYVVCSEMIKKALINFCDGFIYSTAPPPAVIGAADAALNLIPEMEQERRKLLGHSKLLSDRLEEIGFRPGSGQSQIIPVLLESEQSALELSDRLAREQIFVQAIRPPTVRTSRLRLTLTAQHTRNEIEQLLEVLIDGKS